VAMYPLEVSKIGNFNPLLVFSVKMDGNLKKKG
jgi:hypothetical protein